MSTTKKLNQGLVKLTKENIDEGHLGDKIKSISGSDKVLTKKELINERRKEFDFDGVPIKMDFRGSENPYDSKK